MSRPLKSDATARKARLTMSAPAPKPRKLTDEKFVNLYSIARHTEAGTSPWVFASRKSPAHAGTAAADAVAIAATVAAPAGQRLLITREFRVPINRHELSVPSGLIDEGESIETAAAREFHEETGLTLSRILHVSPPLASSAGMSDEAVCIVYGEAEGSVSRDFQTEHENIEVQLLSIDDVRALLRSPGDDVISSRLYPMLVGFVAAGSFIFPSLG